MFSFLKKKPQGTSLTLTITGMHCPSCSMNIDGELEDLKGVISAQTSYATARTEVTIDPNIITTEKVLNVIENLGYTATVAQ